MDAILGVNASKSGFSFSFAGKFGLIVLSLIHFVCAVILTIDISLEIHASVSEKSQEAEHGPVLLVSEILATALLYFAFYQSSRQLLLQRAAIGRMKERLAGVRSEFAGLVDQRFHEWGLSPAETEIALLTVKGVRISEIAEMRDCCEGTVKSHLTSIFKKSGVSSRPELLAHFVDDFLDLSAGD